MPRAIARFRAEHPGVELSMVPAEPDDGVALLRAGEADLAMTITTDMGDACGVSRDGLVHTHVLDDPMYIALPDWHPLARKRGLKLADLADEQWILGSTGTCPDTSLFLRLCERAGFEPRIAFHSDDYLAIQGFVAAGMGASLIPDLALVYVRDDIVIRSLGKRPPVRVLWAATLKDSYCSPARQAMLEVLTEVATEFAENRRALALAS
jgi:DNA-binding transcriptional LysR family regulator